MRLTVFGSTGPTGQQLVRQALGLGHEVIAVARRPEGLGVSDSRLTVVQADVLDPTWRGEGLEGTEAVLSALGTRQMKQPTTIYSQGTATILTAMTACGTSRFIGVSASPLTPDQYRSAIERRVVDRVLYRFFGGGYEDMRRMERLLAESEVDWTIFRPPRLTNGRRSGRARTATNRRLSRAWSVSRADLAAAMLAAISDRGLRREFVAIAK